MRFLPWILIVGVVATLFAHPVEARGRQSWPRLSPGMTTEWAVLKVQRAVASRLLPEVVALPNDQRKEVICLAANIYHEARGESEEGKLGVAFVTRNRVGDRRWAKTVCGVVMQWSRNKRRVRVGQFSWTVDKLSNAPREAASWRAIQRMAYDVLIAKKYIIDPTLGANHYHTINVHPSWASKMGVPLRIGQHLFYRAR